ncbi:hypothetical protein Scep_023276 [Stephania cephalantha]|uniref:Uncharacterized protein n=1 Tax=Stephania cephalantha TaxID=152367 RepID=A0AAP0EUD8_9MAGN
MGTSLQHAVAALTNTDPVGAFGYSGCKTLQEDTSSRNTLFRPQQLLDTMDRILEQCNKESVRMTILKHDKVFKEQVKELHRLYKVQKMLMAELKSNESNIHSLVNQTPIVMRVGSKFKDMPGHSRFWSTGNSSEANQFLFGNWSHPSGQANSGCNNFLQPFSPRTDLSAQEQQSSSCSRETSRTPRKGFDLELPVEENNSTNISAIEDNGEPASRINTSLNSHFLSDGDADVELTLSIGLGASKKKPSSICQQNSSRGVACSLLNNKETRKTDSSTSIRLDPGEESSSFHNSLGATSAAAFDRESLQQPSWLFQTLKLNGT